MASKSGTKKSSGTRKRLEPMPGWERKPTPVEAMVSMRRHELAKLHGKKDSFLMSKTELIADLSGGKWDHRPKDGGDPNVVKPF